VKIWSHSLAQEPFKAIPVIWVISDDLLAHHPGVYELAGAKNLIDDWKSSFRCADVLVFPSYALRVTDLIVSSNDVCGMMLSLSSISPLFCGLSM
jgi:hypothetical protein